MKNMLLLCFALFATSLIAQDYDDPKPAPNFSVKGIFGSGKVDLDAGTIILLETNEKFASDQVTVGKTIQFKVRTNVMADNKVAIRTGALATGRVKAIEPATHNNPEEIRIELEYVQAVDGQMVPLNGNEQSIRGQFPGEGTSVAYATTITAQVMNNQKIKVD
jgi:hypothetical protein